MNFSGNFKSIGKVSIFELKKLVLSLTPQHWIGDTQRQKKYEVHHDTQNIGLVYDDDFRHTNPSVLPPFQMFQEAVMPIIRVVAHYYDTSVIGAKLAPQHGQGYCIRASLVRLNPGGEIAAHQDKNFSLAHSHRVHIPVVSNPNVLFTVGDETLHLAEGEIVEINNRRMHSVTNNSPYERVHLILDWVIKGEQCCCADKTHPGVECTPQNCLDTDRMLTPCVCFG